MNFQQGTFDSSENIVYKVCIQSWTKKSHEIRLTDNLCIDWLANIYTLSKQLNSLLRPNYNEKIYCELTNECYEYCYFKVTHANEYYLYRWKITADKLNFKVKCLVIFFFRFECYCQMFISYFLLRGFESLLADLDRKIVLYKIWLKLNFFCFFNRDFVC